MPDQILLLLEDIGDDPGPILLASNDPSFISGKGSLRDRLKAQNDQRGKDSSPKGGAAQSVISGAPRK